MVFNRLAFKIHPILLILAKLLIVILIVLPKCVAFRRQHLIAQNNDKQKLIALLPKLLILHEKLQQTNIAQTNNKQTDDEEEYDNEWVVEIVGGTEEAKNIARAVGYKYIAPVRGFENIYIFSKDGHRGKRKADSQSTLALRRHKHVLWAEQQQVRKRFKRDHISIMMPNDNYSNHPDDNIFFNDPFWSHQWNLSKEIIQKSSRTMNGERISMQVLEAWKLGYTGKGVVVTILDPEASYDLNDNDPDPMPRFNEMNRHGTRCAGEIAMTPNNSFCGVGIAYNAKIGGVRMLDGKVTDRIEAEALSYNINHIDIFSISWGPADDGKTVEGPGLLTQRAILKGIQQGRDGKGVIYVWASGNGGMKDDDCDCDGYMDSIYTLSVSSVTEDGTSPWYAEKCAATLTSTFSNGDHKMQMITTTDIENKCTATFAGTSASAPMAAAIIALGLDANPSLTWRDVQHIIVWTSDPIPLLDINEGWNRNARGLLVNSRFGFGIMDANAFVTVAKTWQNVPEQHVCTTIFPTFSKRQINDASVTVIKFHTDGCVGQKNEVNFLEHIQLVLDAYYPIRGHLSISIISPNGTKTQLLSVRREDKSSAGFRHWPFMSVHTWGENPRGIWQLYVEDKSMTNKSMTGIISNITLIIYGTKEKPKHYENVKRYRRKSETALKKQLTDPKVAIRMMLHEAQRIVSNNNTLLHKNSPNISSEISPEISFEMLHRIIHFIDDINQQQSRMRQRTDGRRQIGIRSRYHRLNRREMF
uniref:P/Homo B domain-containing protein n=1 Tax=Setaria digitata TaxID=48799 RepID=A0A915PEJ1_9BILA